jgi:hypothetical protein
VLYALWRRRERAAPLSPAASTMQVPLGAARSRRLSIGEGSQATSSTLLRRTSLSSQKEARPAPVQIDALSRLSLRCPQPPPRVWAVAVQVSTKPRPRSVRFPNGSVECYLNHSAGFRRLHTSAFIHRLPRDPVCGRMEPGHLAPLRGTFLRRSRNSHAPAPLLSRRLGRAARAGYKYAGSRAENWGDSLRPLGCLAVNRVVTVVPVERLRRPVGESRAGPRPRQSQAGALHAQRKGGRSPLPVPTLPVDQGSMFPKA